MILLGHLKRDNMPDIFYNLNHIRDKRTFLEDCIDNAYKVRCDELDCHKSFARTATTKTPGEILDIVENAGFVHWVFIVRNPTIPLDGEGPYIEAGLRVNEDLNGPDYFIWIYIRFKKLYYFIEKYKMENK